MNGATEAFFARVKIDPLLEGVGWNLSDVAIVVFRYARPDGTMTKCVYCESS